MGALTLDMRGGMLSETLTFLHNAKQRTPAGGFTDQWATVATARGRHYVVRDRKPETGAAGKPSTIDTLDIVVDASLLTIDPAWRVQLGDGRVFEILEHQRQGSVALVRGRKVA